MTKTETNKTSTTRVGKENYKPKIFPDAPYEFIKEVDQFKNSQQQEARNKLLNDECSIPKTKTEDLDKVDEEVVTKEEEKVVNPKYQNIIKIDWKKNM